MSEWSHILLVEDNPGDSDLIREMMPAVGPDAVNVVCVSRLAAALECVRTDRFNVILLDLGLPDSKGLDTLREMRRGVPDLPVIVLTGNQDEQVGLAAIREGAQDYLVKGRFGESQLVRALRYAVERNRTDEVLRGSEERYRMLFESTKDGIFLLDFETGVITDVNPFMLDMLGYSREELLDKELWEVGLFKDIVPSKEAFLKLQAQGYVRYEDLPLKTKTGMKAEVEFISTVYQAGGRKVIQCNIRDITERRRRERLQVLSTEILGILNSPVALRDMINSVLSAIRRETDFDAVGIRLESGDDFPYLAQSGFSDDFLLTENTLVERDKNGGICRNKDGGICLECTCGLVISGRTDSKNPLFTAGGSFWTNCSFPLLELPADQDPRIHPRNRCIHEGFGSVALIPIRENQKIVGLLQLNNRKKDSLTPEMISFLEGICSNIGIVLTQKQSEEEKSKLEMQLRESRKMESLGQLAGGISHDFNNLLTIINGYSQIILSDPDLKTGMRPKIEEILRAGEMASGLTRQLLVFSRRQIVESRIIELDVIISGIEKMLRRLIRENIILNRKIGPALWQIKADPGNIEQVVMNLVINASDAMPDGGALTVETENVEIDDTNRPEYNSDIRPGFYVMLSVSDTGCGMDDKVRERIFEPFFTTKEVGKGTGLGLATVFGIVKQSNGFIEVQSELGKGTRFRIYFPKAVNEGVAGEEQKEVEDMPAGTETILLSEDEDSIRLMLQEFLQSLGYVVIPACNGGEALELAKNHKGKIHLLLTDVVMPKMNGFELAKHLKSALPEIKLFFMSGYAKPTDTQKMMKLGNNIIQKPIILYTLAVKLREILDK